MNHNFKKNNGISKLDTYVSMENNINPATENIIIEGQGSGMSYCLEQFSSFMKNSHQYYFASIHKQASLVDFENVD